ncbi:MAG: TetR/AcrR family transcriptional regulator [Proteiniphilum sp.]|nr:TetR/AcrR family transcriptional regulator [Proteiniphilum sp.]
MRERIIREAVMLFSRDGIKNVSMDDLASSLGISKRTIYMIFKNKEEIVKNCIHSSQENIYRNITKIIEQSGNIICGFLQIIDHYKFLQLPTGRFRDDVYKYYPEIYQSILKEIEIGNTRLQQLLEEGIKENYFRQNLNFDEVFGACLIIGNIYSERISISRKYLKFNIMINMLRGISTLKGIEIIDKYTEKLSYSNN